MSSITEVKQNASFLQSN